MRETHTQREYKSRLFVDLFRSKGNSGGLFETASSLKQLNRLDDFERSMKDVSFYHMEHISQAAKIAATEEVSSFLSGWIVRE